VQEAYAGDKTAELRDQLQKLKLSAAALSCNKVRLRPDSSEDFTAQFRVYDDFLRTLGGSVLQITDGGKPRGSYSVGVIKSMGAKMNELGKMAKDSGMTVGYHPHFGTV
jgi:sugar phosphate isomerase/epimerase